MAGNFPGLVAGQRTLTGNGDSQGPQAERKHGIASELCYCEVSMLQKAMAQGDSGFLRILLSQPAQTTVPHLVQDVTGSGPLPPSA